MDCRKIKKLIDEADSPDILPFEVNAHLDGCGECSGFAAERSSLASLLMSTGRISAPANFDAVLNRRLAERLAPRKFGFAFPAFSLRFASAAAMVLFVLIAGRVLFNSQLRTQQIAKAPAAMEQAVPKTVVPKTDTPSQTAQLPTIPVRPAFQVQRLPRYAAAANHVQPRREKLATALASVDPTTEAAALILMRGRGTERELAVPVVSVGAQPLVFVSSHSQQGAEPVRVSF